MLSAIDDEIKKVMPLLQEQSQIMIESLRRQIVEHDENLHRELQKTFISISEMMDNETSRRNREFFLKVESELKKLPMELQESFWNAPINVEMFDLVLDPKASNEEKSRKLAAFFVGGENKSS